MQLLWKSTETNWSFWFPHFSGDLGISFYFYCFTNCTYLWFQIVFESHEIFAHRFDDWDDFRKFRLCFQLRFFLLSRNSLTLVAWHRFISKFSVVVRFSVVRCCWKLLRFWTSDSTCFNWTSPSRSGPRDDFNEDFVRWKLRYWRWLWWQASLRCRSWNHHDMKTFAWSRSRSSNWKSFYL